MTQTLSLLLAVGPMLMPNGASRPSCRCGWRRLPHGNKLKPAIWLGKPVHGGFGGPGGRRAGSGHEYRGGLLMRGVANYYGRSASGPGATTRSAAGSFGGRGPRDRCRRFLLSPIRPGCSTMLAGG